MDISLQVITKAATFHYVEGQLLIALTATDEGADVQWELPGTPVYSSLTSLQSLEHMLRTQCGLTPRNVRHREQLYTFEHLAETPQEITALYVTYLYVSSELLWYKGTKHIGLFPIDQLPKISSLDTDIITYARERLRAKALYTTLPAFLLPQQFSLQSYQQVFETLAGRSVDKRNFRKKLSGLEVVHPVKDKQATKRGEVVLYTLRHTTLTVLKKPF